MSEKPVPCSNCGAVMTPMSDGRVYSCPFCRARVQVAIDAQQLAQGMHLDLRNLDAVMVQLANTLSAGFAEHTRIQAHGSYVLSIEVDLDPDGFALRREGQRVVAQYKKMVRGIALKTEQLAPDRWLQKLTEALARRANENARAAWVLGQLTGHQGPTPQH